MTFRFRYALPLLAFAAPAQAAPPGAPQGTTLRGGFQDTAAIDHAVAAFTARPIGAEGGARTAVDARLRLAQCPMVALAWRSDTHDAVTVTCSDPDWRIFVAVIREVPNVAAAPAAVAPVKLAPVIRRGDPVVIEANADGFSIAREGVALADAAPGARFMVRVDDAKGPVQAVAEDSGRATLPGWTE